MSKKPAADRDRPEPVPTTKKLEDLYGLIEKIETAMFTTRRPDGHLVTRPMATQKQVNGADLWFVTDIESHKLDELVFDSHVNVAYYNNKSREWVSVSGTARITQDQAKIRELYEKDWKAWFGDEGGERNGEPGDPRFALIFVDAHSVTYMKNDKPRPIVLFEVAKGIVTGDFTDIGSLRHLNRNELGGESSADMR
jgi:general stress protein 26